MIKFSAQVLEHFQNPRNVGTLDRPDGMGTIGNPVCGDITEIYLRIKNGVIEDAKFKSYGCAVTIASASVFTEKIRGQKIESLVAGKDDEVVRKLVGLIEEELGELPTPKLHCPPATVQAFLEAICGYCEKEGRPQLATRMKGFVPLIASYYRRGEKPDDQA